MGGITGWGGSARATSGAVKKQHSAARLSVGRIIVGDGNAKGRETKVEARLRSIRPQGSREEYWAHLSLETQLRKPS